uniref:Uncharacterized protein n=1 Tax=Sinocyclocheilus grahami TaxID=75366 RepID=A0A672K0H7_SINGR
MVSPCLCLCLVPQEQIDSLVNQVCGKALVRSTADGCIGSSPTKLPAKRGPRKRSTVELSLTHLPTHLSKSAAAAAVS